MSQNTSSTMVRTSLIKPKIVGTSCIALLEVAMSIMSSFSSKSEPKHWSRTIVATFPYIMLYVLATSKQCLSCLEYEPALRQEQLFARDKKGNTPREVAFYCAQYHVHKYLRSVEWEVLGTVPGSSSKITTAIETGDLTTIKSYPFLGAQAPGATGRGPPATTSRGNPRITVRHCPPPPCLRR